MKQLLNFLGQHARLAVAMVVLAVTGIASADYVWWLVDFEDQWENPGELQPNPVAGKSGSYDVWLVAMDKSTGEASAISEKVALEGNSTAYFTQTDLAKYSDGDYVFYVELGASSAIDYCGLYKSANVNYSDLESHTAENLAAMMTPWNAAVGGPWSVPEPSGGFLLLMGTALLMLRRQKNATSVGA